MSRLTGVEKPGGSLAGVVFRSRMSLLGAKGATESVSPVATSTTPLSGALQ